MGSVSRKMPKNDVTNARMSYRNNIKKPTKKANGNQKKETVNEDKYVLLKKNVTEYQNEEDFSVETAEAAENNERTWISILDKINLKIMEELLNNGDIKSSEIALKLGIPLSTIQRRRSMLEKFSVLKKTYSVDPKKLGLRISEVSINTKKGSSQKVMNEIYKGHRKNIIDMSLRIGNPDTNISFRIVYKNSVHLFSLLEEIKANPLVDKVSWSEYITEIKNNPAYFSNLFSL